MDVESDLGSAEQKPSVDTHPRRDGLKAMNPLARRLALSWVIVALVVGAGLLIESATRNGLDGANPIRERVGFAFDEGFPVPSISGVTEGKRTAVLFVRPARAPAICRWAARAPVKGVTMVVVAPERVSCSGVTVNVDKNRKLARGFGMRRSEDGGYPVGFAILDSRGGLRYNTLDRHFHKRNWWDRQLYNGRKWEMQTVLKEVS